MSSKALAGGVAAALTLGVSLASAAPAHADEVPALFRASLASDGRQGNGDSYRPAISADGRVVAFNSLASNLVDDDYDSSSDVFVKDLTTGEITMIGSGFQPSISRDGRYVAFWGGSSVFVHDRETSTTTLVSVATDGTKANGAVGHASLSPDGAFVVFSSTATNLVPGATGTNRKIFLRDLRAGTTTELSVRPDGVSGRRDSNFAVISADSRHVAFVSQSKELVPGGQAQHINAVYVRDLQAGVTRRLNSGYVKGFPAISDDGRFVSFADSTSTLVPDDTNRVTDVFRYDLSTDELIRVNVAPDGSQADQESNYVPQPVPISADGRYVMFQSAATNLVADDTNARGDMFLRDVESGTTVRLSGDSSDGPASGGNYAGALSPDGGVAAFYSELSLTAEDTNQRADVYVWRRG